MGEYLDFLLRGSPDHAVERRGPNTFQITVANDTAEHYAKFDEIVRTAERLASAEGFRILPHRQTRDPAREFDFAVINGREPLENVRPFQPNPSQWASLTWDDAAARIATSHSQRNDASLNSGGSEVFPPTITQVPPANSAATVDTPAGAGAGSAPREIRLETGKYTLEGGSINAGAGGMVANADVASAQRRVIAEGPAISFRDNAVRVEELARALAATVREEIERLEDQRRNEPEWRNQIDFLRSVANTLDNIAAAIAEARRAATPEERDQKFGEAERLATSLAKAAKDFAERNYERVIDYGGYCTMTVLGTLLFTTMFGVSPEFALTSTMVLLGFSGKKKD